MAWTKQRVENVAREYLCGAKLVVVANREPYMHVRDGNGIRCLKPASGLTTALDPVMRACGGVWVAHGSGNADRAMTDLRGHVAVPPEEPSYTLRRVWLTKEEEAGYYYGFANEAIWPLCHVAYQRPKFDKSDWEQYQRVNQKFANAVLGEIGNEPAAVFVQDYHFALLPRLLRNARPDLVIFHFWHIPWPNPEVFRVCPWQEEILDGMLGNDLMAFHIQYHCNNFMETVDRVIEAKLDREQFAVLRHGDTTYVKPQPISIDTEFVVSSLGNGLMKKVRRLRHEFGLGRHKVLLGVERVDYTKGLPERFRAVDRMLQAHPEMKGKFVFLQIGAPSRVHIPAYRKLNEKLAELANEINNRHGRGGWRPILFVNQHIGPETINILYRLSTVCVVSSLHDGMNLVAKEFVAARQDLRGVLVLSSFTGAAREFNEAVLINPFAVDEFADALHVALTMPRAEQQRRMRKLRAKVEQNNIYRWAGRLLTEAGRLLTERE
jgi:trehalose 6-phosphate synthase